MLIWKLYHTISWIILTSSTGQTQNDATLLDSDNNFDIISEDTGFAKKRISRETTTFYGAPKFRDYEGFFELNNTEYILTNVKLKHADAVKYCVNNYNGRLAPIPTVALANFIAEALSESNLINSSIWTAGKTENNVSRTLFWFDGDKRLDELKIEVTKFIDTRKISDGNHKFSFLEFPFTKKVAKMIYIPSRFKRVPDGKDCLAFDRVYLDVPRFQPAYCDELKPILCKRKRKPKLVVRRNNLKSTHSGWIKINDKYYKIFAQPVSWKSARQSCIDDGAILAEPNDYNVCKTLTRYLLIGRPSLTNAWIGASIKKNSLDFEMIESKVSLNTVPDKNNYPPWRNGEEQRPRGCLLLDRETSFESTFLEAHCDRKRSYICSKSEHKPDDEEMEKSSKPIIDEDINKWQDKIIGEVGYRFYYQLFSWEQARNKCNSFKDKYGAQLVEIRSNSTINHLLDTTVSNMSSWKHLWIGATYNVAENTWHWDSDNSRVPIEVLNWVKNETYYDEAENSNKCLNTDRENENEVLIYGTQCAWGQYFVCTFSSEKLRELQNAENGGNKNK